ncbi:hypothetical protein B0H11DRAFT_2036185 [Mycena galericulata]|nr:hypothetical protein B0H11DRAFT_2036185 [Mycena galericulata]
MESEANPLYISELVDHAISFLSSPDDFRACALVSRSWVHPAQSRIFSELAISSNRNDKSLSRLLAILEDSPHLAGFISTLTIRIVVIEPSYLSRLSLLPYRRLTALSISCGNRLGLEESLALQELLSVPSLVSTAFWCAFERREDFLRIWERCSVNIKHYSHWPVMYEPTPQEAIGQAIAVPKRVKLESLHCFSFNSCTSWLEDSECPFDISCLKAFSSSFNDEVHGGLPATAYATIEIISSNLYSNPYDLSGFQRLAQVKIKTDGLEVSSDLGMIRTIHPQNRGILEAIQVCIYSADNIKTWSDLDSEISILQRDFRNLKIVEIVTKLETPTLTKGVEEYFPLINQTTSLRWNFWPGTEAPWYTRIV